ncbi:hypothetical protein ACFU44_00545 [Nocardia rhizosphaerihabitans]|uniref:hypothetical protein n=1 Tax=Nocardia rhizosphaerihabitans TaxID=1691570 RepID=UPI00366E0CF9
MAEQEDQTEERSFAELREAGFEPSRWNYLYTADGSLWMETSDRAEAEAESRKTGYPILREWTKVVTERRWVEESPEDFE